MIKIDAFIILKIRRTFESPDQLTRISNGAEL